MHNWIIKAILFAVLLISMDTFCSSIIKLSMIEQWCFQYSIISFHDIKMHSHWNSISKYRLVETFQMNIYSLCRVILRRDILKGEWYCESFWYPIVKNIQISLDKNVRVNQNVE